MPSRAGHREATLRLLGVNLHELARIFFSPTRQQLVEATGGAGAFHDDVHWAYNVFEDQRIAKLMIDWFPDAAAALVAADMMIVSEYTGDNPAGQAKLLRGRDHLPWPLRKAIEEQYILIFGEQAYDWLCDVIEDYLELRAPDDLESMIELAREFLGLDKASSADPDSVEAQYGRWRPDPIDPFDQDENERTLEDLYQQAMAEAGELALTDPIGAHQHRNQAGILRLL